MDRIVDEADSFEKLAAAVEERAERMRRHAELAWQEADRLGAADDQVKRVRLWEARTHEHSADVLMKTAGLYRTRARELRAMHRPGAAGPGASIARRLAEQRRQIATEREALAVQASERVRAANRP